MNIDPVEVRTDHRVEESVTINLAPVMVKGSIDQVNSNTDHGKLDILRGQMNADQVEGFIMHDEASIDHHEVRTIFSKPVIGRIKITLVDCTIQSSSKNAC